MEVVEILVNPAGTMLALLVPNGQPVDSTPWLLISPADCAGAEGCDWGSDKDVIGWYVVQHDGPESGRDD